jgi:hypothetical protein
LLYLVYPETSIEILRRVYPETKDRFFTAFRMTGDEGLRMKGSEGFAMEKTFFSYCHCEEIVTTDEAIS